MSVTQKYRPEIEESDFSITNPYNLEQRMNNKKNELNSIYSSIKDLYLQFEYELDEVFEKVDENISSVIDEQTLYDFRTELEDKEVIKGELKANLTYVGKLKPGPEDW